MRAIPGFELSNGQSLQVRRWGRIAGCTLRHGDRLHIDQGVAEGLVALVPRGLGRPMLGRVTRSGLRAEPGDVPASALRWQVLGRVARVERALERGGPEAGAWQVAVRITPIEGRDASPDAAREALRGGKLGAGEVEALLLRAVMAGQRWGVDVSVGLARTAARADALAQHSPPGTVSFVLDPEALVAEAAAQPGQLIEGPWAPPGAARGRGVDRPNTMQVPLFADSRTA